MDCRRVRRIVFLYAEKEMEADLASALRAHLERCPHCLEQRQAALRLFAALKRACSCRPAPEHLRVRIRTVLQLRDE